MSKDFGLNAGDFVELKSEIDLQLNIISAGSTLVPINYGMAELVLAGHGRGFPSE
jgi:hypothetical protein